VRGSGWIRKGRAFTPCKNSPDRFVSEKLSQNCVSGAALARRGSASDWLRRAEVPFDAANAEAGCDCRGEGGAKTHLCDGAAPRAAAAVALEQDVAALQVRVHHLARRILKVVSNTVGELERGGASVARTTWESQKWACGEGVRGDRVPRTAGTRPADDCACSRSMQLNPKAAGPLNPDILLESTWCRCRCSRALATSAAVSRIAA
jgi:hypothetical protein